MLSTILAYILSVAMLAGAAGLPATPDTLESASFENVVIRVNDESFALDSRAVFAAAAGMEESLLGLYLENGGSKFFPIAAKITPEEAVFSISESGSAFRITDQALMEMMGISAEELPEVYQGEEMQQMLTGLSPKEIMKNEDVAWNFLCAYEGAEVIESDINFNGADYPGSTVTIENAYPAILAMLDDIAQGDYGALSKYMNDLLAGYREELDMQGDSFAEMFAERGEEIPPMTLEFSRADVDGDTLENVICTMDEEDTYLEFSVISCRNQESVLLDMEIEEGNYTISADAAVDMFNIGTDEDKRIDASCTFVLDTDYINPVVSDITQENRVMKAEMEYSMEEKGGETAYTAGGKVENWLEYDHVCAEVISSDNFSLDALVTRGEGNAHIKADFTADLAEQDLDIGLEFDINTASEAYIDPFEGRKTVDFSTPEELTQSGQFIADGMAFAMDAMRIGFTQDARKIGEIAALLSAPKEVSEEKYAAVVAESGLQLPEFTLPEGWHMKDADALEGMVKLVFASGEDEYELAVSELKENIPVEAYAEPSFIYWDDAKREVLAVNMIHGDLMMSFWFDCVDAEFAREVVSGVK